MNHSPHGVRLVFVGSRSGVSLTELMIAVVVMTIGVLGLIGSFASIQKGIQLSKNKTLASNLAQEKMQILKQKTYYQVIATPATNGNNTAYTPNIPYDILYFPPENILEGGVNYQRLTYIEVVRENSGILEKLGPETPDTGMRLITITILWQEGGVKKKLAISSVLANQNTVMANAIFQGTVRNATSVIPGALVNVAENIGWRDTTNASGFYSINLSPGNFTLMASAPGYYSLFQAVSIAAGAATNLDFTLAPIASGTVSGTAWVNPGIVISQVVASTAQADGFVVQYIELFNPTLAAVTIGGSPPPIKVNYQTATSCANQALCAEPTYGIKLNYLNNSIAAGGYYIIANTGTFMVNGHYVYADAVFNDNDNSNGSCSTPPPNWNTGASPPIKQIISMTSGAGAMGHGGDVWLTDASGNTIDSVGWTHGGNAHPNCSPNCIPFPAGAGGGLADGLQIVRTSSPNFTSDAWGRAYDSGNSTLDFTTTTVQYRAFSTADGVQPVIAGVPAVGAVISANDGLSDPATAYAVGSPPRAVFSLTNVATGTWTVLLSSGQYVLENDTVTIAALGSVYTFPSSTTRINQPAAYGFISGVVVNVSGAPISAPTAIPVSPGQAGANQNANTANGRYLLVVTPGSVDVTANVGNANVNYVSISSLSVSVALGQIVNGVDFVLSQGGRLTGFITRDGTNALPGVAVAAIDVNGLSRDQQVSDTSGRFTTINIATGVYQVTPSVDSLETSSPTYRNATVVGGQTVFAGTFTITGALGTISGQVTSGGSRIATGVLIVVTTSTLAGSPPAPPALNSGTLASAPYYIASSLEDGSYSIDVRQSTSPAYRIYGYYTTISNNGAVTITAQSLTGVQVLAGQTVTGKNLAW